MSIPTQRPTGRTGVSESEAWWSRSPAPISIPLDPALTRRELARLPKAPERIRAAYEQRGSPPVLPALVREIANELNLHQRQVENVLSLLPRKRETMTKTMTKTETPEARPKLTALLPTERPEALRNLNWERAYRVAAILDRLGVDLRYFVAEPVTAKIADELNTTTSNVSQYTSAVRRACGIECLGRRPEGGAGAVKPAPVTEPAEWEPEPALCSRCNDDGAADGCSKCGAWDKASLASLLPPTEAQRARQLLEAELLQHKAQCEAAVKRAQTAEAQLEQTMEQWAKLVTDHAVLESRLADLQARDTQPVEARQASGYEALGQEVGALVAEKNAAYGNSFAECGEFLQMLYPDGIDPEQYGDALCLVRIFDKCKRIATARDAFGENPYRDIAGYGLLGLALGGR